MFLGYIDPGAGFNFTGSLAIFGSLLIGLAGAFLKRIYRFFKSHKPYFFILLILSLTIAGANLMHRQNNFEKKIVVIGIDGLSPQIVEPMMDEGQLPNLQKLRASGLYKRLKTTNPAQSPVAWAAFETGKNPGENGIYDFVIRDPHTLKIELSTASISGNSAKNNLKSRPFWHYSSKKNIDNVIISAPLSFPASSLKGRLLSGMGVPDLLGTEGTFTFYTTEDIGDKKDIGGNVYRIPKNEKLTLNIIGPLKTLFGKTENIR
ncbi:MAG TPA: alkaline phosphatase family protein, partial [Candidatus Omnitrophota bacterium]|nr:alkaline phosphatase family protein [Candidatus Omnitrophota bacterium]